LEAKRVFNSYYESKLTQIKILHWLQMEPEWNGLIVPNLIVQHSKRVFIGIRCKAVIEKHSRELLESYFVVFVLFCFVLINIYHQSSSFLFWYPKVFSPNRNFDRQLHACSTCNQITFDYIFAAKVFIKRRWMWFLCLGFSPSFKRSKYWPKNNHLFIWCFLPLLLLFVLFLGLLKSDRLVHRKLAWLKIASSLDLQLIGRDRLIWTVYRFFWVNRGL